MDQDWVNDWYRLGAVGDVAADSAVQIDVAGFLVVLFNRDGELIAASDRCGDCSGSLSKGDIEDNAVWCPGCGRGYRFAAGSVQVERARHRLLTFPTMVVDDEVFAWIEALLSTLRS